MNDFGTFVRHQQEPLRRFLLSLCGGDLQLADDLAQESFIKAYVSFHTFGSRSRISTWLFRIAYNTFIDWTRKRKGETSGLEEAGAVPSDETPEKQFGNEELYLAIGRLSVHEKAVTLLFYMEDRPIREISEITGMNANTVKSHLSRARMHLKGYLSEKGGRQI